MLFACRWEAVDLMRQRMVFSSRITVGRGWGGRMTQQGRGTNFQLLESRGRQQPDARSINLHHEDEHC